MYITRGHNHPTQNSCFPLQQHPGPIFTHVFQVHIKFPLVSPSISPGQNLASLQSPTLGYPDVFRQMLILQVGIFCTKYDYLFPLPLFIPLFFLSSPPPQKSSSQDCSAPSKNEALEELCCSTRALTKKVIKYGNPFLNWHSDSRIQNLGSSCLHPFCCPWEN